VATPDGATPGGDGETRALAASEIGDETSSWSPGWIGDGETRALCGRVICFFKLGSLWEKRVGPSHTNGSFRPSEPLFGPSRTTLCFSSFMLCCY
jgi:hypothetical protein